MSLLLSIFPTFSGRPSPEIRAFLGEKIGILFERAINHVNLIFLTLKNLKIRPFSTHFCDQAHNRTMATNNRIIRAWRFQLFGYTNYIIGYNSAKFHCSSFFGFSIGGGGGVEGMTLYVS